LWYKLTKRSKGNENHKQEINENKTWNRIWTLQREKARKWSWSENQDA